VGWVKDTVTNGDGRFCPTNRRKIRFEKWYESGSNFITFCHCLTDSNLPRPQNAHRLLADEQVMKYVMHITEDEAKKRAKEEAAAAAKRLNFSAGVAGVVNDDVPDELYVPDGADVPGTDGAGAADGTPDAEPPADGSVPAGGASDNAPSKPKKVKKGGDRAKAETVDPPPAGGAGDGEQAGDAREAAAAQEDPAPADTPPQVDSPTHAPSLMRHGRLGRWEEVR
jgi:hypothetical protein